MASSFNGDIDFYDASSDSLASSATLNSSHSSVSESSSSLSSFLSVCSLGGSTSGRSSASGDVKPVLPALTHSDSKPHKANDAAWEAIRAVRCRDGNVGLNHFKLVRRLGSGDIGNVYLCQLRSPSHDLYAMKVVDREALAYRNKLHRAEMEKQILSTLDHPFLPTLYTHFGASHYSCLVMDFCPGGDLHSLRQRQDGKRFSLRSARFYAAEVLLALEYLHMMGVIFRDLKPENVLVRADGHIMLSDFDLSLKCDVVPTLQKRSNTTIPQSKSNKELLHSAPATRTVHSPCVRPPCSIEPVISCFFPSSKKSTLRYREPLPELVAEPTEARSKSFVGTHEYLAPEVISGQGHGSAVDWYTFGIFLFELLYGRTPFKGANNEATLTNILTQPLKFPEKSARDMEAWDAARDLMRRLLAKDPRRRFGSSRGAADIKRHPFFKGINWPLIRSMAPPEIRNYPLPLGTRGTAIAKAAQQHSVELVPPPCFEFF